MIKIDREELAWAAGFFDGEGNIRVAERHNQLGFTVQLRVGQAHLESLMEFKRILLNKGQIRSKSIKLNRKPMWEYQASGFENCQFIIAMLWPFLRVKKAQAMSVLLKIQGSNTRYRRSKNSKTCGSGHNIELLAGYRRECARQRSLKRNILDRETRQLLKVLSS